MGSAASFCAAMVAEHFQEYVSLRGLDPKSLRPMMMILIKMMMMMMMVMMIMMMMMMMVMMIMR